MTSSFRCKRVEAPIRPMAGKERALRLCVAPACRFRVLGCGAANFGSAQEHNLGMYWRHRFIMLRGRTCPLFAFVLAVTFRLALTLLLQRSKSVFTRRRVGGHGCMWMVRMGGG